MDADLVTVTVANGPAKAAGGMAISDGPGSEETALPISLSSANLWHRCNRTQPRIKPLGLGLPLPHAACIAKPSVGTTINHMVITHTKDKNGNIRLYLGGNASFECWIEPAADSIAWSLHFDEGVTSYGLSSTDQRACAAHLLDQLCHRLRVAREQLKTVTFERLASLHDENPFESRRTATPKRTERQHAYMATAPDIRRPTSDFTADDFTRQRGRQ